MSPMPPIRPPETPLGPGWPSEDEGLGIAPIEPISGGVQETVQPFADPSEPLVFAVAISLDTDSDETAYEFRRNLEWALQSRGCSVAFRGPLLRGSRAFVSLFRPPPRLPQSGLHEMVEAACDQAHRSYTGIVRPALLVWIATGTLAGMLGVADPAPPIGPDIVNPPAFVASPGVSEVWGVDTATKLLAPLEGANVGFVRLRRRRRDEDSDLDDRTSSS